MPSHKTPKNTYHFDNSVKIINSYQITLILGSQERLNIQPTLKRTIHDLLSFRTYISIISFSEQEERTG